MYLPVIDTFERTEKKQEINELEKTIHTLEGLFEPFMNHMDTDRQSDSKSISDLNDSDDSMTPIQIQSSDQTNCNDSNIYKRLQQYTQNMETITHFAKSISDSKDIFNKLYANYDNVHTFYGFEPLFKMANDYVVNALQNITYDSTFFDVTVVKNRGNELPTLYFHRKPDKIDEMDRARKRPRSIIDVGLTPKKKEHVVMLEFYNTSLPDSQVIQTSKTKAERLTTLIKSKYSQKPPFWVRVLPKGAREKWDVSNKERLNETYKQINSLKNDLKAFTRNFNVALQTDEVVNIRQAIEDDLRRYVDAINDELGTTLTVEVKYTCISVYYAQD